MKIITLLIDSQFVTVMIVILACLSVLAAIYALRYDRHHRMLKEDFKKELEKQKQLEEKSLRLQTEARQLREELAIKTQMYEGLKEQYNELEKDFEKSNQ